MNRSTTLAAAALTVLALGAPATHAAPIRKLASVPKKVAVKPALKTPDKRDAKAACVPPAVATTPAFALGERLDFEIDSLGATIGAFEMKVLRGRGDAAWVVRATAKTGTLAASFYPVDAVADAFLSRDLSSSRYVEDATEKGVRRTVDVRFPVPAGGRLPVKYTRDGTSKHYQLPAPAQTRDLLSAIYGLRGTTLDDGAAFCMPVFAQRRVWTMEAKVEGREDVRTPLGDFKTIHVSGVARRVDRPGVKREVHFWLTDDASQTPVAAFGLVQNKPVRAQLVGMDKGRQRVAQAPRR